MQTFPCPLCQNPLEIKDSKKGKPYLVCEDDGLQMFVRYRRGIRRLTEISERGISIFEDFVVCNSCEIAVKKSEKNISHPILGANGIYCPECGELLLKEDNGVN